MAEAPLSEANLPSARAVAEYLRAHPDFFADREALLETLLLPHTRAGAVSLVERQIALLRERNRDLEQRLQALLGSARDNDHLFEKTQRLLFGLLEGQDLGDLIDAVCFSFDKDFAIHFTRVHLFGDPHKLTGGAALVADGAALRPLLSQLNAQQRAYTGALSEAQARLLFGEQAGEVGSAAVLPLVNAASCWQGRRARAARQDANPDGLFGVIAIANRDPQFYRSSMGTLFLSFIGEVLNRLLPPLIAEAEDGPSR